MSSSAETSVSASTLTCGTFLCSVFVEKLDKTLGQAGALVSAASKLRRSSTEVLSSSAALDILHRDTENPGPFSDVSKVPEYILVGLISHLESVNFQYL